MAEKQPIKEQIKKLTDQIEAGIKALFQSGNLEKYQAYLRTMSHFHHYSVNNQMLIFSQCPHATLVAGYQKWQNQFSRHVLRGEKGISILAPTPYKIKVEKESSTPIRNCHCWMQTAIQSRKKKKSRFRCSVRSRFLM